MPQSVRWAVDAAREKQAGDVVVLDLTAQPTFTDRFVVCTGYSTRQVQSISDAVEEALGRRGARAHHREGYAAGEWVLLDYGDFVVHIFHERTRLFYDIERLWRAAPRTAFPGDAPAGAAQP